MLEFILYIYNNNSNKLTILGVNFLVPVVLITN